jgi:hypothetical protein
MVGGGPMPVNGYFQRFPDGPTGASACFFYVTGEQDLDRAFIREDDGKRTLPRWQEMPAALDSPVLRGWAQPTTV